MGPVHGVTSLMIVEPTTHNVRTSFIKRSLLHLRLWLHTLGRLYASRHPLLVQRIIMREIRERETFGPRILLGPCFTKYNDWDLTGLTPWLSCPRMWILGELSQLRGPLEYRHGSVGCCKWTTTSRHDLEWQLDCQSLRRIERILSLGWKFTLELWPLIEVFFFITNVSWCNDWL